MNKQNSQETAHLSSETNAKLKEAMQIAVEKIIDYFGAPHAAKPNLAQELKTANNVVNSFARIRSSESGHEAVRLQLAKALCEDKEELRKFTESNLPHVDLSMGKKLKA